MDRIKDVEGLVDKKPDEVNAASKVGGKDFPVSQHESLTLQPDDKDHDLAGKDYGACPI